MADIGFMQLTQLHIDYVEISVHTVRSVLRTVNVIIAIIVDSGVAQSSVVGRSLFIKNIVHQ